MARHAGVSVLLLSMLAPWGAAATEGSGGAVRAANEGRREPYLVMARHRKLHFEIMLEGGLGVAHSERSTFFSGVARAEPGVVYYLDTFQLFLLASYEYSSLSPATFGVRAVLIDSQFTYLHADAGVMMDLEQRPGVSVSLGLFAPAIEAQYRWGEAGPAWAVWLKLSVPVFTMVDEFTYLRRTE